jgi:hypothetical protein
VYASCFVPGPLSNIQGLRGIFPEICTKCNVVPLSDTLRNRMRPDTRLQIKERKKVSTSIYLREILDADSQDMIVLLLHRAITTAIQMAEPVPEIMDILSYTLWHCYLRDVLCCV